MCLAAYQKLKETEARETELRLVLEEKLNDSLAEQKKAEPFSRAMWMHWGRVIMLQAILKNHTRPALLDRLEQAEARNAELLKAINDAYPTIAGHVISLEKAGETVAHEQWAKIARQLYEVMRGGDRK